MATLRCVVGCGCAGEIGFSAALEELSSSLFNGKLPPAWARLNPATEKALGPWMAWFTRRHEQYKVGTAMTWPVALLIQSPLLGAPISGHRCLRRGQVAQCNVDAACHMLWVMGGVAFMQLAARIVLPAQLDSWPGRHQLSRLITILHSHSNPTDMT